jgi:hypothetical protein
VYFKTTTYTENQQFEVLANASSQKLYYIVDTKIQNIFYILNKEENSFLAKIF